MQAKKRRQKLKRALMRQKSTGLAVDPRLVAEVKGHEDHLAKTGMSSFKATQMGGGLGDSDSSGESSDDGNKFARAVPKTQSITQDDAEYF